jgi:hypothetical protein
MHTRTLDYTQQQQLKKDLLMGNVHMTITAPLVRHVQRGLHLSLAGACVELAEQAQLMASDGATHPRSREYGNALDRLDNVRRCLNAIGWDESTTLPVDPSRLDAKGGGWHDTPVLLAWYFDTLYDALGNVIEALGGEGAGDSGACASLLELHRTLDGWIESATQSAEEADKARRAQGAGTMEIAWPAAA